VAGGWFPFLPTPFARPPECHRDAAVTARAIRAERGGVSRPTAPGVVFREIFVSFQSVLSWRQLPVMPPAPDPPVPDPVCVPPRCLTDVVGAVIVAALVGAVEAVVV
jgi:hypothetical protein